MEQILESNLIIQVLRKTYTLLICIIFWDNIFSSYVNIETMNIISSDVEMNRFFFTDLSFFTAA